MKIFELPFQQVRNPVTFKEVEDLRSYNEFKCKASNSQLMKRLDKDAALEILKHLKNEEKVVLK